VVSFCPSSRRLFLRSGSRKPLREILWLSVAVRLVNGLNKYGRAHVGYLYGCLAAEYFLPPTKIDTSRGIYTGLYQALRSESVAPNGVIGPVKIKLRLTKHLPRYETCFRVVDEDI